MACLKVISLVPHNQEDCRNVRISNMKKKMKSGFGRLPEDDCRFGKVGVRNFVGRGRKSGLTRCETGGLNETEGEERRKMRILIAGGGIAGMVLALAARKRGFDVKLFERDLSAIRGEGMHRGPIQLQSNALAVLEAIDEEASQRIMEAGCITGNRVNGLVDGVSGMSKYDLFKPAAQRGLPITRVIPRTALQDILANAVGPDYIYNGCNVVDFKEDATKVTVILDDGRKFEGDVLVGADRIRSKVREQLFGPEAPNYSDYTCYSGIADFVPADISTIGYRVFIGHKQYFVSSDVGHGKMQWYAFRYQPAGVADPPSGMKQELLKIFGNWCPDVVNLLLATSESDILRRDIYDRNMIPKWSKSFVTLVGDSAHAMQPNLGQGGCMAIEDSYQLVLELDKVKGVEGNDKYHSEIASALERYEWKRIPRVTVVHGMSRMASRMITDYQPYLVDGLKPAPFTWKRWMTQPFSAGLQSFISFWVNLLTVWILTGNGSQLQGHVKNCGLSDTSGSYSA